MKTLIIDDERLARKELIQLLSKYPEIQIEGECSNGEEALQMIEQLQPDLIFLDVQMPGMTGFELIEKLESVPHVIFVTAYDDYALKAFEVNAMDYVLKPVEEDRLAEAVQRVIRAKMMEDQRMRASQELRLGQTDQIFLKDGEKCWFITLDQVKMFESEGNYVRVFFGTFKPLILKSLNNLEERLDHTFFRVNRKFIVNLRWVQSVENWFNGGLRLTLKDGTQVEVSRRQSARFREMMSL
jgi:two-component system LytT family response regulator